MIIQDNRTEKNIYDCIDKHKTKQEIRKYILNLWLEEKPNTQYRYFVEKFKNSQAQEKRIYLQRPAQLNKGCDFVIYCEDLIIFKNGNDKPPKHSFIIEDIQNKKSKNNDLEILKKSIEHIFNCQSYLKATENLSDLKKWGNGLSYEVILKLLKWYFIEQDITYWLRTGRNMLWDGIQNVC